MALTYLDSGKVDAITSDYWNTFFPLSPYYQPTGYPYSLTDTPDAQPVFGQATGTFTWNSQGSVNGGSDTGVIAVLADNRNGELGDPATLNVEAQYGTSQGFSATYDTSEAVTKSFETGVNLKFFGIGSDTSFTISGTTTYGSGTTDSHVTTTTQDESFSFDTPVGKAYEGQLWHSVETVELPFTLTLHVTGTTTATPTIDTQNDPYGLTLTSPIGPIFAWVHDQGSGGPVGDDYVNYAQDPTNPNAGLYTLHGTLTAYSGGAFYVQVVDATNTQPSDAVTTSPPVSVDVSVQQFASAGATGADPSDQGGGGVTPSTVSVPLDQDAIDGLAKAYWQDHFGVQYSFQFTNSQGLSATADWQPSFGTPEYVPTTLYPPFYGVINNIDGLQQSLGLSTTLTYSQQDGFDTTHTTGGAVDKSFEQKVSYDFGDIGGVNADFKIEGNFSWSDSTADSQSTTSTQTVGPFSVTSDPGQAKQLQVTHTQEAISAPYQTVVHVTGTAEAQTFDLSDGYSGPTETISAGDLFQWVHDQGANGPAGANYILYSRDPDNPADGLLTLSGQVTVYSDANADIYDVSAVDLTDAIQQNPSNYPPTTPLTSQAPDL